MDTRLKKSLAWILSISLLLGSGGSGLMDHMVSWAAVGAEGQELVTASDSQASVKTEMAEQGEGTDGDVAAGEETGGDEINRNQTDKDETGRDGDSADGTIKEVTDSIDKSGVDEGDGRDGEVLVDEGHHSATKSDAAFRPDDTDQKDDGGPVEDEQKETDVDVATLIDAEDDTYGYEYVTSDGIKIMVKVTASDWPEDTELKVEKVAGQEQQRVTDLVENALEKKAVSMVYAYDISFWSKGETFEPDGEVEVTFQFPEEEKERFKGKNEIFHIKDEADHADIMQKESETEMGVSCRADGFSVYGVALMSAGPIAIYSAEELRAIDNNLSADYILMNDIDLAGWGGWEPIGVTTGSAYTGNFDGDGHTIYNLHINTPLYSGDHAYAGLFGVINQKGSVKNLTLDTCFIEIEDTNFGGWFSSGFICAVIGSRADDTINGRIVNCHVLNAVERISLDSRAMHLTYVGGIAGNVVDCDSISKCTFEGKIDIVVPNSSASIGGIIGATTSTQNNRFLIDKCENRGEIHASGVSATIGGICGWYDCYISQCVNYGNIYWNNTIDCIHDSYVGGIVGECTCNDGNIKDCFNIGNIDVDDVRISVGGILGGASTPDLLSLTSNVYNIGDIHVSDEAWVSMKENGSGYIGGILGYYPVDIGKVENAYCLNGLDITYPYGGNDILENMLNGSEMTLQSSFNGFDFNSIWKMGEGDYRYPILQWQDEGPSMPNVPSEDQPTIPNVPSEDRPAMPEDPRPNITSSNSGFGSSRRKPHHDKDSTNVSTNSAKENGWSFEDGAWRYQQKGVRAKDEWVYIDEKWYYFKDDTSMVHSCLYEIGGEFYSFNADGAAEYGWQVRNPGDKDHLYYFMPGIDRGDALTGWQNGIEGDNYKYFFWTDGYTKKDGIIQAKGSLAFAEGEAAYEGIYKDGILAFIVDRQGHLLTDSTTNVGGIDYDTDTNGNVSLSKTVDAATYIYQGNNTPYCTVTSSAMMVKRKALLSSDPNWKAIDGIGKDPATDKLWSSGGMSNNDTYRKGDSVYGIASDDPDDV